MAQKFGNGRWVREGYLDNRVAGCVVGRITFAAVGAVPFYLVGNFKGEIYGKAIRFQNSRFADEELAAQALADFEVPQVGEVGLISFDPHPLLPPHPYIEWFSLRRNHYRIELAQEDAWVLSDREAVELDADSRSIREDLRDQVRSTSDCDDFEWI